MMLVARARERHAQSSVDSPIGRLPSHVQQLGDNSCASQGGKLHCTRAPVRVEYQFTGPRYFHPDCFDIDEPAQPR
eukprot:9052385-Alexandrium_andersonii.AAC.1